MNKLRLGGIPMWGCSAITLSILATASSPAFGEISTRFGGFDIVLGGKVQTFIDGGQHYLSPVVNGATQTALDAVLSPTGTSLIGGATGNPTFFVTDDNFNQDAAIGDISVKVSRLTPYYEYGGVVEQHVLLTDEFDPFDYTYNDLGQQVLRGNETDAHLFMRGNLMTLQLGTGIDGYQNALYTDELSAGPLSADHEVTSRLVSEQTLNGNGGTRFGSGGSFDLHPERDDGTSLVISSQVINGFQAAGEFDSSDRWAASLSYRGTINNLDVLGVVAIDDTEAVVGRAQVERGPWTLGGFAGSDDDDETYYGGGVKLNMGAVDVSAEASLSESDDPILGDNSGPGANFTFTPAAGQTYEELDVVGGVSYEFLPGLVLDGSVKYSDHSILGEAVGLRGRVSLTF